LAELAITTPSWLLGWILISYYEALDYLVGGKIKARKSSQLNA
jgi:hypothetical protein